MDQMPQRIGSEAFRRMMTMQGRTNELRRRDVPERHWYLWVLGVEPERQGQGIGGALTQPVFARADAEGLPCYLETDKPDNVPFYRKHGFAVVEEEDLPNGGCHFWTMKRPSRQ